MYEKVTSDELVMILVHVLILVVVVFVTCL